MLNRSGVFDSIRDTQPAQLLAGDANAEDAAIWRIDSHNAIVATTDFFAPMVDNPRDFGRIAAANAISDVYAMGGMPLFALALAAMPSALLSDEDIADIFTGGAQCCNDAGIVIAGGHSIEAAEPLYGLAVIGRIAVDKIITNSGAQAGDNIILGKPLGTGLFAAAHRKQELSADNYQLMINTITTLNRAGMNMPNINGVHAMTDVTGFGLLGHLSEMCEAAKCGAQINFDSLPIFEHARFLARQGTVTGASKRNWKSSGHLIRGNLEAWQQTIITDPQTGGGLLIACAAPAVNDVLATLKDSGCDKAAVIGSFTDSGRVEILNNV